MGREVDYYGLMQQIHRFRLIPLACALVFATSYGWAQTAASHTAPSHKPATESAISEGELFYETLLGEITTRTGDPGAGYALILDAARRSGSAQLYQRAADIALQSRSGEYALAAAKAWKEDQPQSRDANRYVLQILIALNQVSETLEPLQQFLRQTPLPNRVGVLTAIPQMYARVSDKAAAAKVVQEAISTELSSPTLSSAGWITVGRMQLAAGNKTAAMDALTKARAADASNDGQARLALDLMEEGNKDAEPFVTRFLQQQNASEIRMLYARVLLGQSRFAEAVEQLTRTTQEKPDLAEAWLLLASLQAQNQQLVQAEQSLSRFLELAQNTSEPLSNARVLEQAYLLGAQIAEKRGDVPAAQEWLKRIDNAEDSFSVQRMRASLLARQGRMPEARVLLRNIPERNAEAQRMKLLAEAQLLKDNQLYEEAYKIQADLLKQNPEDNDLAYEQAMLAEKAGKLDVMESLLRGIIQRQPDYHHAYNALGYSLADRGIKLQEARRLILKALEFAPDDPFISDSLAWVEFRLGNKAEAQRLLKAAFEKKPDAEIAAHWGEVLWSQGDTEKAKSVWREGLRLNPDNSTLKETLKRLGVSL